MWVDVKNGHPGGQYPHPPAADSCPLCGTPGAWRAPETSEAPDNGDSPGTKSVDSLLSPAAAAARLGIKARTLLEDLPIPRVKLGHRTVRFREEDIDRYEVYRDARRATRRLAKFVTCHTCGTTDCFHKEAAFKITSPWRERRTPSEAEWDNAHRALRRAQNACAICGEQDVPCRHVAKRERAIMKALEVVAAMAEPPAVTKRVEAYLAAAPAPTP